MLATTTPTGLPIRPAWPRMALLKLPLTGGIRIRSSRLFLAVMAALWLLGGKSVRGFSEEICGEAAMTFTGEAELPSASAAAAGEEEGLPVETLPAEGMDPDLPDGMRFDPAVLPAQGIVPAGVVPSSPPAANLPAANLSGNQAVVDPPAPLVRIQVRIPAASPPGKELVYHIHVRNTSSAPAYNVVVRNPVPETAEFVTADPGPEKPAGAGSAPPPAPPLLTPTGQNPAAAPPPPAPSPSAAVLVWKLGTLAAGESRTIRLTLRPKPDAQEVRNLAYVSYEHGQAVTTRLRPPALQLSKAAPQQAVRDEPLLVRIRLRNTGSVPVENIRLVENVPVSAEVEPITAGGKRASTPPSSPPAQQWVWEIPRLLPGQYQIIEYRLTPRESRDVLTLTHVSAAGGIQEKAEAHTAVLVPGLSVQVTGPPGNAPVPPGAPAKVEILVRNTGTLPALQVRVRGSIPPDCKPTRKTEGGQWLSDALVWIIPRLEPGEARTFRYELKAATTGRRLLTVTATDARGQQARQELAILFQGTPALSWETIPQPLSLSVGQQGTLTIRVRNGGGEAARNVRLEVELPDAVAFRDSQPSVSPAAAKLLFPPQTIPPSGEAVFTITYQARQPAQAWFRLRLSADHLGEHPMLTEKMVEILGASTPSAPPPSP
ncbi:MAG: hypothetical protein N3E46_10925 [Gemmataceae bacterium]|nr:hypothetical protein [Gemmataceae bacterium]